MAPQDPYRFNSIAVGVDFFLSTSSCLNGKFRVNFKYVISGRAGKKHCARFGGITFGLLITNNLFVLCFVPFIKSVSSHRSRSVHVENLLESKNCVCNSWVLAAAATCWTWCFVINFEISLLSQKHQTFKTMLFEQTNIHLVNATQKLVKIYMEGNCSSNSSRNQSAPQLNVIARFVCSCFFFYFSSHYYVCFFFAIHFESKLLWTWLWFLMNCFKLTWISCFSFILQNYFYISHFFLSSGFGRLLSAIKHNVYVCHSKR